MGASKGGIIGSVVLVNSLIYAAAGWWLGRSSGRPLLRRVTVIVLTVIALHSLALWTDIA
jgi:hypothetical protein